jgi:hypothetical protein
MWGQCHAPATSHPLQGHSGRGLEKQYFTVTEVWTVQILASRYTDYAMPDPAEQVSNFNQISMWLNIDQCKVNYTVLTIALFQASAVK